MSAPKTSMPVLDGSERPGSRREDLRKSSPAERVRVIKDAFAIVRAITQGADLMEDVIDDVFADLRDPRQRDDDYGDRLRDAVASLCVLMGNLGAAVAEQDNDGELSKLEQGLVVVEERLSQSLRTRA